MTVALWESRVHERIATPYKEPSMKNFNKIALALGFCVACVLSASLPASAQTTQVFGRGQQPAEERVLLVGNLTDAQTFATTSYADLAGSSVTFTPSRDPSTAIYYGGPNNVVYAKVYYTIQITKATATTGICAVYANGAIIDQSAATVDFAAKANNMSGTFFVALTSGASQTVKMQCKSGDTNTATVADGQVVVSEVF